MSSNSAKMIYLVKQAFSCVTVLAKRGFRSRSLDALDLSIADDKFSSSVNKQLNL